MRTKSRNTPIVSIFPFLSVLLCTMGVLAFMSISFVLIPTEESSPEKKKTVEFQWVGAPAYVQPVFFHCRENTITFENVFLKTTQEVTIERLLTELQQKKGAVLQLSLIHISEPTRPY